MHEIEGEEKNLYKAISIMEENNSEEQYP